MILGFKTRLDPNKVQATQLAKHAGCSRWAYNWGLRVLIDHFEENKDLPKEEKENIPSHIDLHKRLVKEIKPLFPWFYESSKCAPQYALRDVRQALDRFFKGQNNFPKFKKKSHKQSFEVDGTCKVFKDCVQIPRMGKVRVFEDLAGLEGRVKNFTISKEGGYWYISWKREVEEQPPRLPLEAVGIDLGLKELATCSDGLIIENQRSLRAHLAKLKNLQRSLSRKKKGSKNRLKTKEKISKLHHKISNIRKDVNHQWTTRLTKTYDVICIEDLHVQGMVKNHNLALSVSDAGWSMSRKMLEYKVRKHGSRLVVIDRFFPSTKTCSSCRKKQDMPLSKRIYRCSCGLKMDRDLNASINIREEGLRILRLGWGSG